MSSKVSFTIRPPTSSSRLSTHSARYIEVPTTRPGSFTPHPIDSSDEDEEDGAIEAVTGFDQSGAQRLHEKPKPSGPLVIPALANRDWRAMARLRKQQSFIPDGAAAPIGKDGSQGGLGTRDSINSGPQAAGLMMRKKEHITNTDESTEIESETVPTVTTEKVDESEDERARRALLASVAGGDADTEAITIDAIPTGDNNYTLLTDEADAYRQDVITRPDSATLADYERVPVSQFGAALLRGMGWKEGTAASRTRQGLVEPWLPTSRPALLGIGAKERPAEDNLATGKAGFASKRPDKRYVPVVKLQREGSKGSEHPPPSRSRSRSPSRSGTASRMPSKSASPYPTDQDKDRQRRHGDHDRSYDTHNHDRSGRHRDRGGRDREPRRDYDHGHRGTWNDRERDKQRDRDSRRGSRRERDL